MAPLPSTFLTLFTRNASPTSPTSRSSIFDNGLALPTSTLSSLSPMAIHELHRRSDLTTSTHYSPGKGAKDPNSFNNKGYFALFAILGAAMVLASIWFFFIHPNGGFKWRNGDWEDYKSTVLRRKGPDGKTLSNATKSTKLGGGSIVHDQGTYGAPTTVSSGYRDETGTTVTSNAGYTEKPPEMRQVAGDGLRGGDGERRKKKHRRHKERDPELAEYRTEKPATVGGMNRDHDGSYFDYSNQGSEVSYGSQAPILTEKDKEKKEKAEQKAKKERAIARMKAAKKAEKAKEKEAAETAKKEKEAAKKEQKAEKQREKERAKEAKAKAKEDKKTKKENQPENDNTTVVTATDYQDFAAVPPVPAMPARPDKAATAESPRHSKPYGQIRPVKPSGAYSFTAGEPDNITTVSSSSANRDSRTETTTSSGHRSASYYEQYRPHKANPQQSRQGSPRKHHRSSQEGYRSSHYQSRSRPDSTTDITSESQGTASRYAPSSFASGVKAGSVAPGESISQVGVPTNGRRGRDVMQGYRRSGAGSRGQRDELDDSEEE